MSEALAGSRRAIEDLEELDRKVQKSIVRKCTRAGCKVWLSLARSEAPDLTGKIRKNIKIRGGGSKKGSFALTVGVSAKDFVGEAFYAGFVLYGHKVGNRKLGDARKSVPANNFLERTFDAAHEEAVEVAKDTAEELIHAEMKG